MRVVLLSSRARAGTSEVLAQVRATIARHATVVGEFDVNDTLPSDLKADRAVVIGGDGSIMACAANFHGSRNAGGWRQHRAPRIPCGV